MKEYVIILISGASGTHAVADTAGTVEEAFRIRQEYDDTKKNPYHEYRVYQLVGGMR